MINLDVYAKVGASETLLYRKGRTPDQFYLDMRRLLFQFEADTRILVFSPEELAVWDRRSPLLTYTRVLEDPEGTEGYIYRYTHSRDELIRDFPNLLTIVTGYVNRRNELMTDELREQAFALVTGLQSSRKEAL